MCRRALAVLLTTTCGLTGCLQLPEAASAPAAAQAVTIAARDQAGDPAPLDALPRRPVLVLQHPRGFAEVEAIVLLEGGADDALLEDLAAAPLRAEHASRVLAVDVVERRRSVRVTPRAVLARSASYTLAVLGSAKDADATPLFDDRGPRTFALRTSSAPDAGAAVTRTFPADAATGIAVNLAAAVIAFDGEVLGAEQGVWLEDAAGHAAPTELEQGSCHAIAPEFAAEHCARLVPISSLAALADYAIVVGEAARDARGGAVGPLRARFRTGTGADHRGPGTLPLPCALDELPVEPGCALLDDRSVRLRVQADEPVTAELTRDADRTGGVADQGELALALSGLAPDAPIALELRLLDGAGNPRTFALALRTTPVLETLSIDELRTDPLGPEPAQEYVELHNFGRAPVELLGMAVTDDALEPGVAIERALRLDPGARVLLVGSAFDADDTRDGALPPGVALLRGSSAIAGSGLSNAGEALFLRNAAGQRLSGAPASPKPPSGRCLQRVGADPRDVGAEAFAPAVCTPGF